MTEREVLVGNKTFNLMELSQVSGIESLVSEDAVDREVFHGLEFLLLGLLEEHLGADRRSVRTQDVFHSFLGGPARAVAD